MTSETDSAKILARIDRSSPDKLLNSLVDELVLLHRANEALRARIAAIETHQSICDQVLDYQGEPTELPRSVYVDAAFSLRSENGFYAIEYGATGAPYRWTGPEPTFHFEMQIDRSSACALTMRFLQVFMHASYENIVRCFVDSQEVEANTQEIDSELELHATLPPRKASGGTVVSFVCPHVTSPSDVSNSEDPRPLGLAFRWLEVESLLPATHVMNGKTMPELFRAGLDDEERLGNGLDVTGAHLPEQGEDNVTSSPS